MNRMFLLALLAGAAVPAASQPAAAFWQRSQVSRCNDATTESERQKLRCWRPSRASSTTNGPRPSRPRRS